jgi:hypothetical protein
MLGLAITVTWQPMRYGPDGLRRAEFIPSTALRWSALKTEARNRLRERPSDASAWVALAWLEAKVPGSAQLAAWGQYLDPTNKGIQESARQLIR